jgi:dnd system-associated protein 4
MATKDRIYIDKELVPVADRLVKRLIPGSQDVQGVFRDTRELVVFAAGLGFRKSRTREPSAQGREIKLEAVERIELGGTEIVNAIAVATSGSVAILAPEKAMDRAEIFEQYVNGGLEYIAGLVEAEATPMAVIARLLMLEHAPSEVREEVLDLLGQRL